MQQENQEVTPARCAELVPFATTAQGRCLAALAAAGGNFTRAAKALGVARGTVRDAFSGAKLRAARRGFAPDYGWQEPVMVRTEPVGTVPAGFKVKGVSDLVDEDGKRKQAWIKSTESPVEDAHPAIPTGLMPVRISEGKDGQGKTFARWTQYRPEEAERFAALESAIRASVAEFVRPLEPVAPPKNTDRRTMAVYPMGDPHLGMLAHADETGDDHDLKIAERDLRGAMDRLVAGMPRCRIGVILPLGDNFHADDDNQRTPAHHHKLDVDTRAHKVARVGINVMRYLIDKALTIHDEVHVRIASGNHDPVTSMWLRLCLEGWYSHEPRVTVFTDVAHLQVWEFGLNMCGVCHGDGIKVADMQGVMSARFPEMWGRTTFRFGYQGHKHKKELLERHGLLVEVFRTLAGKDSFAAKYGYESGRCMEGLVLHELYGLIERKMVDITLARAMLETGVKL